MKRISAVIGLILLGSLSLLMTSCGPSWYFVKASPGLYIKSEVVLKPGLLNLIKEKRQNLKLVLRVPSLPKNATVQELMQIDKRYDFFERELAKAGFIVRDRALLDKILSEEKTPSYQDIYNKIDTDLIIEIVQLASFTFSNGTYFEPNTWAKTVLTGTTFAMTGARLDCRLITVKDGEVTGMMTIYLLPCNGGPCDFEYSSELGARNPEPNPQGIHGYGTGSDEDSARGLAQLLVETITDNNLVIEKVLPGSLAEKNGLQVGDNILTINGRPIYNRSHISEVLTQAEGTIEITVLRQGRSQTVSFPKKLAEPIGVVFKAISSSDVFVPSSAPNTAPPSPAPNQGKILK